MAIASLLVVLALVLAACGGSGDASRSDSAKPPDRRAGNYVARNISMWFYNANSRELWLDWRSGTSRFSTSWDTPKSAPLYTHQHGRYEEFPFRMILENNGGVKKYVEVDASNPLVGRPDVTVAGEQVSFSLLADPNDPDAIGTDHTFTGDGWSLRVKRLNDNGDYIVFDATFKRS